MKMKNNKITCLICFYIKDDILLFKKAIESIKNQSLFPNEIIICVDGKVLDFQKKAIEKYKNIAKIIWIPKNVGHGKARKIALSQVKNEFIAIFDSDDYSFPERLAVLQKEISKDSKIGVISGTVRENWKDGCITYRNPNNLDFKFASPVNQNCCLMRNSAYKQSGGYLDWYHNEDTYLWTRMLISNWKIKAVNLVLADVYVDLESVKRRQGLKYFFSEIKLRKFMYKNSLISFSDLMLNFFIRTIIQLVLPSLIYKKFYQWKRKKS